jgi:chloramphenicol 3-O-phosphotransferase
MVAEALEDTRVVTINGARQSGKSTLAQVVAATQDPVRSLTLDDPVALRAAEDDPAGQHSLRFGDRLRALPIDTLWQATPQ